MTPRSAHLVLREWYDPAGWAKAARRYPDPPDVEDALSRLPGTPQQRTSEHWFEAPRRVREEREGMIAVRDGSHWVMRTPQGAVHRGTDPPGGLATTASRILSLLDPAELLAGLELDERGMGERAGRPVAVARALRKPGTDVVAVHPLEIYAEAWELELDAGTGALLAGRSLIDGAPYSTFEAQVAEFDVPIDPRRFHMAL